MTTSIRRAPKLDAAHEPPEQGSVIGVDIRGTKSPLASRLRHAGPSTVLLSRPFDRACRLSR